MIDTNLNTRDHHRRCATIMSAQVLKSAEARVIEERSAVVRRLHAGSKSWVETILQRERRYDLSSKQESHLSMSRPNRVIRDDQRRACERRFLACGLVRCATKVLAACIQASGFPAWRKSIGVRTCLCLKRLLIWAASTKHDPW